MRAVRKPALEPVRERANRLLEHILEDLAAEGLLEPAVAADGSKGYRITAAGLDYLARHGAAKAEQPLGFAQ